MLLLYFFPELSIVLIQILLLWLVNYTWAFDFLKICCKSFSLIIRNTYFLAKSNLACLVQWILPFFLQVVVAEILDQLRGLYVHNIVSWCIKCFEILPLLFYLILQSSRVVWLHDVVVIAVALDDCGQCSLGLLLRGHPILVDVVDFIIDCLDSVLYFLLNQMLTIGSFWHTYALVSVHFN